MSSMPAWLQTLRSTGTAPGEGGLIGATLADPLWLLGRQWQVGERRGHDGGYPARARFALAEEAIQPIAGHDPANVPMEPILEGSARDDWTPGRRVRVGRAMAEARPELSDADDLALRGLPPPYEALDGTGLDGAILWDRRGALGLTEADFASAGTGSERPDFYDAGGFQHSAEARTASVTLRAARHRGGEVDWFTFDGASDPSGGPAALPDPGAAADPASRRHVFTRRLDLPGAPLPGWWSLGDLRADFASLGVLPDRPGLASLLVLLARVRDWVTFPIQSKAGHIVRVGDAALIDTFGTGISLGGPFAPPGGFSTRGLPPDHLVLLPPPPVPLSGPPLDVVDLAPDEWANLFWAVERRVGGRDRPAGAPPARPEASSAPRASARIGGSPSFSYAHASPTRPRFVAYVVEPGEPLGSWLVQARIVAPDGTSIAATSDLLRGSDGTAHRIRRGAVPPLGLTLTIRYKLTRDAAGHPVLWRERRAVPPGARADRIFRFDVLADHP